MEKCFNTSGMCTEDKHYMVNQSDKIEKISKLIDEEHYFSIIRPKQFGKTTILDQLIKKVGKRYIVIHVSFQGIGEEVYNSEAKFSKVILQLMSENIEMIHSEESAAIEKESYRVENLKDLSKTITRLVTSIHNDIVLFIDGVNKGLEKEIFHDFIDMLKRKYHGREMKRDRTFKSVVIFGTENFGWDISAEFEEDMGFKPKDIETMIDDYASHKGIEMDSFHASKYIYFYTGGYPYLVSRVCRSIDREYPKGVVISKKHIKDAVKKIAEEKNTVFDSIIKGIEESSELRKLLERMMLEGEVITFNPLSSGIQMGINLGIFRKEKNRTAISNKLFERVIYNYLISSIEHKAKNISMYNVRESMVNSDGKLHIDRVLEGFQQYIKEQFFNKGEELDEHSVRSLFMVFIKPVIDECGFQFKEMHVSQEKRMDIVIDYNDKKYVIEIKLWRGEEYHKKGLCEMGEYLERYKLEEGYLLVINTLTRGDYKLEDIHIGGKDIYAVYI